MLSLETEGKKWFWKYSMFISSKEREEKKGWSEEIVDVY
jgi:hypothetical protein